jgi:NADH:ubiquinone oxidoreductase subunit 2 (subunit N)
MVGHCSIAAIPFHQWAPDADGRPPASWIHVGGGKGSRPAMLRILPLACSPCHRLPMIVFRCHRTMTGANLAAPTQNNTKRRCIPSIAHSVTCSPSSHAELLSRHSRFSLTA